MEQILSSFRDLGVELNTDWLAELELCADQALTQEDVYLALMYSDLRVSCLPLASSPVSSETLATAARMPQGSFLFQITSAVDISIPDAQRPRTAEGITEKRMLRLHLHSSSSVGIDALELEPIACLANEPDAGCKIILAGAPHIHKGLVLLRSENVRLVGGDVAVLSEAQRKRTLERLRSRDPLCGRKPLREIQNIVYA